MANDPIHQFQVSRWIPIDVGGVDLSFTNVSAFMVATVVVASGFLYLTSSGRGLIPTRLQSVSEMAYEFVATSLRDSAGSKGMKFFPFVFSLFMFVLVANFLGLFPYFYTVTSQIIVTFALAVLVIGTVIVYGFFKHGIGFLKLFVPSGVPGIIVPLVVAIEIISFLSRPISLSVRLFANMLAGHITLKVFAGFVVSLAALGPIGIGGAVLPLIMTVAITALEFLVAFPAGLRVYRSHLHVHQRRSTSGTLSSSRRATARTEIRAYIQSRRSLTWKRKQQSTSAPVSPVSVWPVRLSASAISFGQYLSGALRNPSAADSQFGRLVFGFAVTEALGIFSLLIALLLLFAV